MFLQEASFMVSRCAVIHCHLSNYWSPITDHRLLITDYWSPTTYYRLLTIEFCAWIKKSPRFSGRDFFIYYIPISLINSKLYFGWSQIEFYLFYLPLFYSPLRAGGDIRQTQFVPFPTISYSWLFHSLPDLRCGTGRCHSLSNAIIICDY